MKPNSSAPSSWPHWYDDSQSNGPDAAGTLRITRRLTAAPRDRCSRGETPGVASPSSEAARRVTSNGIGLAVGPSKTAIKLELPRENTLEDGTRCNTGRAAHSPRVPPPMRRPGKVLRGAAPTAEEQMTFTTNAQNRDVAIALTN